MFARPLSHVLLTEFIDVVHSVANSSYFIMMFTNGSQTMKLTVTYPV